jgi:Mce-associated membrane protein
MSTDDADREHEASAEEPAPTGPPTRKARARWLPVVLVLVAVAAITVAVVQSTRHDDLQAQVDRREAAADVAARFAERLLSYTHDALDEQATGIAELATEEFADEYRTALDQGLAASIEELDATSSATITHVLADESEGGRARVIVIVDSEIRSEAGTRTSVGTYLDVSLLHLDGRWQVNDVRTVANQASGDQGSEDQGEPGEP